MTPKIIKSKKKTHTHSSKTFHLLEISLFDIDYITTSYQG